VSVPSQFRSTWAINLLPLFPNCRETGILDPGPRSLPRLLSRPQPETAKTPDDETIPRMTRVKHPPELWVATSLPLRVARKCHDYVMGRRRWQQRGAE
jgi:hypothetical protein